MTRQLALLLFISLALAGCPAGKNLKTTVPESELAALSPEERAGIDNARGDVDLATQSVNAAKAELTSSQRAYDISKEEVRKAKAGVAISETNYKSAQEGAAAGGNADELLAARNQKDRANATLHAAKVEQTHQGTVVDLAKAKLGEAEAWLTHSRAKVELEKARAIARKSGDTSPEAQTKLASFEEQAAKANRNHANRRITTAKAQKSADQARDKSEAARASIPAG